MTPTAIDTLMKLAVAKGKPVQFHELNSRAVSRLVIDGLVELYVAPSAMEARFGPLAAQYRLTMKGWQAVARLSVRPSTTPRRQPKPYPVPARVTNKKTSPEDAWLPEWMRERQILAN